MTTLTFGCFFLLANFTRRGKRDVCENRAPEISFHRELRHGHGLRGRRRCVSADSKSAAPTRTFIRRCRSSSSSTGLSFIKATTAKRLSPTPCPFAALRTLALEKSAAPQEAG